MNKKLILLTRPEAGAQSFARLLDERGYATLSEPLLTIAPTHAVLNTEGVRGTLLTSRHALSAVTPHRELHDLRCYIVGEASAEAARTAGFTRITHAPTARALAETIAPGSAPLLYARGKHVSFPLAQTLAKRGIEVREHIAYEARAAKHFSAAARAAITEERIAVIPFFSARAGAIFAALIEREELTAHLRTASAIAISAAAARTIQNLPWKNCIISSKPDALHLAAAIDKGMRKS